MVANLLNEAGVDHVMTLDLHASQMQGFFHCPVDNLVAQPVIAHWIKVNIRDWRRAVVVSKNPGGTKRVTSLADALKLNFGIVMTDRRRPGSGHASTSASMILDGSPGRGLADYEDQTETFSSSHHGISHADREGPERHGSGHTAARPTTPRRRTAQHGYSDSPMSPLRQSHKADDDSVETIAIELTRVQTAPSATRFTDGNTDDEDEDDDVDPVSCSSFVL